MREFFDGEAIIVYLLGVTWILSVLWVVSELQAK